MRLVIKKSFQKICIACVFIFFSIAMLSCTGHNPYRYFQQLASGSSASQSDLFYIKLNTNSYTDSGNQPIPYIMSSMDGLEFDLTECGVHKDDEPVEDRYCLLELNEMDLLSGLADNPEIKIEYNVPAEMCAYTSLQFPWHFNTKPVRVSGYVLTYKPEQDNSDNNSNTNTDSIEKCYARCDANLSSCRGFGFVPVSTSPPSSKSECPTGWYEQRKSDRRTLVEIAFLDQLRNPEDADGDEPEYCPLGTYQEIEYKLDDDGAFIPSQPKEVQSTGSFRKCMGGPARFSWDTFSSKLELPIPRIINTWDQGINNTQDLKRAISVVSTKVAGQLSSHAISYSIPIANYYTGIEDLQWNGDCVNCPELFTGEDDKGNIVLGYPYYTLECLDTNFEATHRVHLVIREWNTYDEFINYLDTNGSAGDPDTDGEEGANCNYYEPDEFEGSQCNDLYDLDDIINKERKINGIDSSVCHRRALGATSGISSYPCIRKSFLQ